MYDDWEIPPGKSLRKKIFEEGISDCDAFFVYLTQDSINSNWVSRELDAAFIEQSKEKNTEILTFVSNTDLIKKLPSEIQSLKCSTINNDNFEEGFRNLITSIYEAKILSILKQRNLESENKISDLEKANKDLEAKISSSSKDIDMQSIEETLQATIFRAKNIHFSALELFEKLWPLFADGAHYSSIMPVYEKMSKRDIFEFSEIVSPFIIRNLVVKKEEMNNLHRMEDYYYLTDLGQQFASYITKEGYTFNKVERKKLVSKDS